MSQSHEPESGEDLGAALDAFEGSELTFVICGTNTMSTVYTAWELDGRGLDWRICPDDDGLDDYLSKLTDEHSIVLLSNDPLMISACQHDKIVQRFYLDPEEGIRLPGNIRPMQIPDTFDILSSVPREFAQICGKGIGSAWDKWRAEHDPEERILKRLSEDGG